MTNEAAPQPAPQANPGAERDRHPATAESLLVPARMLNELAYCPRLFGLEWLNGEWADSADTEEGRTVHRRVDREGGAPLPSPFRAEGEPDSAAQEEEWPPEVKATRSVLLGDPRLALIARIDLLESGGGAVCPVDYKRGAAPDVAEGAWLPERVQIAAQVLLLRAHGYHCPGGELYFAASKTRVAVPVDERLEEITLGLRDEALNIVRSMRLPEPLRDSQKCPRCSLVGICLPDEHWRLKDEGATVRTLLPARDDGVPLYVKQYGGVIGKDHDEIVVRDPKHGEVGRARFAETTRLVVLGNATVTTPLLRELAERDIPVSFHSYSGWFSGMVVPASGRNVLTRIAQFGAAADPARSIAIARAMVETKISNTRVLLRRNGERVPEEALLRMKELAQDALRAERIDVLMGIEGAAARLYFEHFPKMLKAPLRDSFQMEGRNRRPPRDPVNAMLSFAYACLVREITDMLAGVGLDAWVGFLHQPRPGRPALALDLMEEFRPILADSVVITAINNGIVKRDDFIVRPVGVTMSPRGKTAFIQCWERRLDELVNHPTFDVRLSYRRVLEVQARLLGKTLLGEASPYPGFRVR